MTDHAQASSSILDMLQWSSRWPRKSNERRVTVVQSTEDQCCSCLLHHILGNMTLELKFLKTEAHHFVHVVFFGGSVSRVTPRSHSVSWIQWTSTSGKYPYGRWQLVQSFSTQNNTNSVFVVLSCKHLEAHQDWISAVYSSNDDMPSFWRLVEYSTYTCLLSAYCW